MFLRTSWIMPNILYFLPGIPVVHMSMPSTFSAWFAGLSSLTFSSSSGGTVVVKVSNAHADKPSTKKRICSGFMRGLSEFIF
jgi:hypothetical protein